LRDSAASRLGGDAANACLDQHVIGTADHDEVFHPIATQQEQLAMAIDVE
jgi:hypothetical protein